MNSTLTLARLRAYAVTRTLFTARDLGEAIAALGFVQLDPIRAPSRAQDLILRQRVPDYRDGDLHRHYAKLSLTEGHLHVYGVMTLAVQQLLHPRSRVGRWRIEREHPRLAARIMAHIVKHGPTHPRDLQRALASISVVNAWGGQSVATTRMLEVMHYRGLLRVAHRVQGIRVYEAAPPPAADASRVERTEGVLRLLVHLYAPLSEPTLRELARMALDDGAGASGSRRRKLAVDRFLGSEHLAHGDCDGTTYIWPSSEATDGEADDRVRLLAPFDPVVWDRRRFEHFWGWPYRFEAYTPQAKRRFGYYALPLLWRDHVVGWANVASVEDALEVRLGFTAKRPRSALFRRELDAELARIASFLGVTHRPKISEER